MKKKIDSNRLIEAHRLMQPSKPILCTTKNEDNSDHVAPFSWLIPVSCNPPRIGLALLSKPKKQHSLVNIERTGEFVINYPDTKILEKMVEASYDLRIHDNKFKRSGFKRRKSLKVEPTSIEECKVHLECKVRNIENTGDHSLIIADVVEAVYDDESFSEDLLVKLENFEPVIHLKDYCMDSYQTHLFLSPLCTKVIEVEYPKQKYEEDDYETKEI
jgi:flavin reductase (DIM6/NTAB) family NADH-FMN oxidoreductase RutF